jgi:hypothetical protein
MARSRTLMLGGGRTRGRFATSPTPVARQPGDRRADPEAALGRMVSGTIAGRR